MVDEPVDEGGGDHGVAEDLAPGLEPAQRRRDENAALRDELAIAYGHQRERART